MRCSAVALLAALALLGSAQAQTAPPERPRIGLVLSGGGARGLAHVGVLKVLEREHVPIDVIAGTSMGAIIGGLYASGMSADELERELLRVRWDNLFASRVERRELSQRRKEEDFEISPVLELGLRDGEFRTPQGAVSSRGLESLLRRYTLPVRGVQRFDELPIPFRAVATDMESGQPVILSEGDLALALRSSMSVPGVFSPTEIDGRVLGDGGLVNNVPVNVARAMGADVLIVVNIGTPLAARDTLATAFGVTQQMINILTEQNVQRSLATLQPADVLVSPQLGKLTAADFDSALAFIELGRRGAEQMVPRLAALALDAPRYAEWRAAHPQPQAPHATLSFVRITGSTQTVPERLTAQLESQPGQPFDAAQAERDARALAATGDYVRADYRLLPEMQGDGLEFELEDKPWGPHYFRIGLDLSTDFAGRSAFNLKISHNRHWLTRNGGEWRNRLQLGAVPLWYTELYEPLNVTRGPAFDWFVAGYAGIERREVSAFDRDSGNELGVFQRGTERVGIDLGQPWGRLGELRLGLTKLRMRTTPRILSSDFPDPSFTGDALTETGLRARAVIDQLDYATFPQSGYRIEAEGVTGEVRRTESQRFNRVEANALTVGSWGRHTFSLYGQMLAVDQARSAAVGRYALGGFQQLSGYKPGQLEGNYLLFGRLAWYMRLSQTPTLTRGFFFGASLEAGNAWLRKADLSLGDLRTGMSVFFGADTGIGPLYFGLTHAPHGSTGITLFLGRP